MRTRLRGATDWLPPGGIAQRSRPWACACRIGFWLLITLNSIPWLAVAASVPIVGWGHNYYGQATPPAAATNIVALSAGWQHALALREDGTLVSWGWTNFNLAQVPTAATNVVAMTAGAYHNLALRADGAVLAWGNNDSGQTNVPADATNVVALAGGYQHSMALRADGTLVAWGDNTLDQLNVPAAATNVVAIAAGLDYTLALKADGSLVGWGYLVSSDIEVPASATNVAAIAAGAYDALVLRSDGSLLAWGRDLFGESDVSTNAVNVTAIAAGEVFSLAALQDGTVIGWGDDYYGQSTAPTSVMNPLAIYAGDDFSLAWLRDPSNGVAPRLWRNPADQMIPGGNTLFLYPGINGTPPLRFQWFFHDAPMPGQTNGWLALPNANPTQTGGYSIVVSNDFGALTSAVANITVPAIVLTTQPTNVTGMMNTSVTLTATAAGTAPLSFRWQKDGQDLSDTSRVSGSATPTLAVTSLQPGDTGSYRLVVTNAYAAVTSDVAVLSVLLPRPLLNLDFGGGTQSLKTGLAAIGQTAADYWNYYTAGSPGVTNLLLADGSRTAFGVVVSNAPYSNINDWTDPMLHDFIYQDQFGGVFNVSLFGLPPGTYDFYLYTAGGNYFPWLGSDFELVVGGVSLGHTIFYGFGPDTPPWVEGVHYGTFHNVRVSAPGQTVVIVARGNSSEYPNIGGLQIGQFLTSAAPPVFWSQPLSQFVPTGTNIVLSASGSGYPAPTQQWFFNGAALTNSARITGADTNLLTVAAARLADTGDYYAIIANGSGTVTSAVAHVVVGVPPALILQPTNQTWIAGTTRLLSAQATGTDPLAYQWYLGAAALTNSAHLSGTASNALTVSNVASSDAGTYTLIITNLFGSITCTAVLAVVVPPAFISQPPGYSVPVGLPVTLAAPVSGTAPLSYQWQFNETNIPGATSNTLSFAALAPADFGDYRLVVTNFGGALTSTVAQLTIGPVATWGSYSQNLGGPLWPGPGLSNVIAVAGGSGYSLALRGDGTLYAWGSGTAASIPAGLYGIVGIAAGLGHALAIRTDGTVAAWGSNSSGQTNVPPGLSNVVAVTAGACHSAALRADGTVVVWGGSSRTGETNIPPGLTRIAAIDAGGAQTLALRENGTVVGWGGTPPATPVPPYMHGVLGIASGFASGCLSLALLTNGTVVAWNGSGLATNIPPGLTNLAAVEASSGPSGQELYPAGVSLVLKSNGTVIAWGTSAGGITNVPSGLSNAVALAAGTTHALALVNDGGPLVVRPPVGGTFYSGSDVVLQAKALGNAPCSFQWFKDGNPLPEGTNLTLVLPAAQSTDAGSYQLVVSNALGVAQSIPAPVGIVDSAPLLLSQPASGFAYYGSPFAVGASVVGSGPLQLSWMQDNSLIAAGTDELAFSRALPHHGGAYQLIACNPFGSVTSSVARITFSRLASWGTGPSLTNAPVDLGTVLGVASGYFHALAIQSNGTVAAWGTTLNGATNVPPGLSNVVAVAGGDYFSMAQRSDGTVTTWGSGIPLLTNLLAGLSNVVAISAGGNHALALRADGTVAAWGLNSSGQTSVPAGLSNVVAATAGSVHSLALQSDGTIVGWGAYGPIPSYTTAVAISAGYGQSLLLQADGTVVGWTPKGAMTLPGGLTNVVAISAGGGYQGWSHCVALRADGTLVAWGDNSVGQLTVPPDLLSATAISAGGGSTLAFLNDRSPAITVEPWNRSVPAGTNVMLGALAVGQPALGYQWYCNGQALPGATSNWLVFTYTHPTNSGAYQLVATNAYGAVTSVVATLTVPIPAVRLTPLGLGANGFSFSFPSLRSVLYIVESKASLTAGTWTELERRSGTGGTETVTDASAGSATRFYRVRTE